MEEFTLTIKADPIEALDDVSKMQKRPNETEFKF